MTADRRDGYEASEAPRSELNSPDELAMAVERVTTRVFEVGPAPSVSLNPADLCLILSRLASQEETIRADGEALKPFARYIDVLETMGGNTPRTGTYCGVTSSVMGEAEITIEDMQEARSRLKARAA